MKKITLIALLALFLGACGSNSKSSSSRIKSADVSDQAKVVLADKNSDEKVVCKQIRKTGSNRATTVCRSASEMEAARKATQFQLRETQHRTGTGAAENRGR